MITLPVKQNESTIAIPFAAPQSRLIFTIILGILSLVFKENMMNLPLKLQHPLRGKFIIHLNTVLTEHFEFKMFINEIIIVTTETILSSDH